MLSSSEELHPSLLLPLQESPNYPKPQENSATRKLFLLSQAAERRVQYLW